MRITYFFVCALLAAGLAGRAHADILSTFNSDAEGWRIVAFADLSLGNFTPVNAYDPSYSATGGNPGGFIYSEDVDGGDFTFSAPARFLGNRVGASGLSYDLTHDVGSTNYSAPDLLLTSSNKNLVWTQSPELIPTSDWMTVNVAFAPSSQWRVGAPDGELATGADFAEVLGDLQGIYLRGEFAYGPDTTGLDNVALLGVVVPEPGSVVLLLAGLLVWGCGRALTGRRRC